MMMIRSIIIIIPLSVMMILCFGSKSYLCNDDRSQQMIQQVVGSSSDDIKFEEAYPYPYPYPYPCSNNNNNYFGGSCGNYEFTGADGMINSSKTMFYVDTYGAVGDGIHDDTQAFHEAWVEACSCSSAVGATFVVPPAKTYFLKPITFLGPCKSQILFQIYGNIEASEKITDYSKDIRHWILFDSIKNLTVQGGGTINGNGKTWWQISCKINKKLPCTKAPTAMSFSQCQNLVVEHLTFHNAQNIHLQFEECVHVLASHITVNSPADSPNTDGIHVKATQNIQISNCNIAAGDDCISIVSGSNNLVATNIVCGAGHGISIGSLGIQDSEAHVSDITVNGATLSSTTNGVRIKTWQGGYGNVNNIKFQNVVMRNVKYPIIIDQFYCDIPGACKQQGSAVQVSNVLYENIRGTSATPAAIDIKCSKAFPCQGIVLENVDLVGQGGKTVNAICNNVNFQYVGNVIPRCP